MSTALPVLAASRPLASFAALAAHDAARPVAGALAAAPGATTSTTSAPIFIIPNGTFFAELILFVIVLGIVAKFILPPIQKAMDEREQAVRSALHASDEGRSESARLARERVEILDRARAEARTILEQAARSAEASLDAARAAGQAEYGRLLAEAAPGVEAEAVRVRSELTGRLSELVLAAAGRVVGATVDPTRHAGVLDETTATARRGGGD